MQLDDPQRLSTLRASRIDSADDPVLTEIVTRIAREAETPIALVSLVMDRVQLFRAAVGLPAELALARATNRCDSFCQFVVLEEGLFVVEDAPNDARVPKALVERYGVTAYAGAPLYVDGHVLGSLCVLDTRPRVFSAATLEAIVAAAAEASSRLSSLSQNEAPASAANVDISAALALLKRQLQTVHAAVSMGTPLMSSLAEIPREAWSVERIDLSAETLGEAAMFYRSLSTAIQKCQAITTLLARASASSDGRQIDAVIQGVHRVGRHLAEGLSFVRVIEALADNAIGVGEASRTLSVLHVALGFSSDMLASVKEALVALETVESMGVSGGANP